MKNMNRLQLTTISITHTFTTARLEITTRLVDQYRVKNVYLNKRSINGTLQFLRLEL